MQKNRYHKFEIFSHTPYYYIRLLRTQGQGRRERQRERQRKRDKERDEKGDKEI